jgi:hypothetical protein
MLSTSLKNKIRENFSKDDRGLELEAKFGRFGRNGFESSLDKQHFIRTKQYFDKMAKPTISKTTDYVMNRVRKTVTDSGEISWMTKERLWNEDLYDYNIRYSMSREIKSNPITSHFTPELIREKFRSSYLVFNNTVRIDITTVDTFAKNEKRTSYEVEIELIDKKALDNFEKAINVTLRLVLDTLILYTEKERFAVSTEINGILGSAKKGYIDHYPLVQARNLKTRDMVFGGIVGGANSYTVTHKTEGIRKMLYFARNGVWLASPSSITRISNVEIPTLTGSILDGESVPLENRFNDAPKSRFWFLIFDTLSWLNDNSIQNYPHSQRMEYAQTVSNTWKSDVLTINTKSFFAFNTPAEFFEVMREMFRQQLLLPYKEDGFMFTPSSSIYNPHTADKLPLYKRVLTDYPDICKWKPIGELTIDLLLRKGKPYSIEKNELIPFTKFEIAETELTENIPEDSVVEFGYDPEQKLLTPRRIRFDKEKPNRRDVAEDVAEDIRNPIDEETMKGDSFALLRKYHNSIKKNLFLSVQDEKTLLDIGSGYGGDLGKWKNFTRIVAVEPDPEHVEELKKRLVTYGMQDKVRVVIAGGQETEKISREVEEWLGGKADVISSMLSLTFFWQSSDLVDSLVNTISTNLKLGGKYLFLTMDGDLVEQTFEPVFGTGQTLKELKLGPADLKYNSNIFPKELSINIEGTIVENQREWLVRLDDLRLKLGNKGIHLQVLRKADEEKFLNEPETLMTRMYTYGSFLRTESEKNEVVNPEVANNVTKNVPNEVANNVADEIVNDVANEVVKKTKINLPPLVKHAEIEDESEEEEELGMLKMDKMEYVACTWFDETVVRIGSEGDGSCAIHSILNAFLKIYQTNPSSKFRRDFAKRLRKDIADMLTKPDPKHPGKTYYETAAKGSFPELYEQQLLGVNFQDVFKQKLDFSIEGLQKLFNSTCFLGDELYSFVAELLDIDLYVMRITNRDLYPHLNTHEPGIDRRTVAIVGNGRHFETIGIIRNDLCQTFFEPNDPFILKIREFSS